MAAPSLIARLKHPIDRCSHIDTIHFIEVEPQPLPEYQDRRHWWRALSAKVRVCQLELYYQPY
jgi:hypothetical protein